MKSYEYLEQENAQLRHQGQKLIERCACLEGTAKALLKRVKSLESQRDFERSINERITNLSKAVNYLRQDAPKNNPQ